MQQADFFGGAADYFPAREIKTNDFSAFVSFDIETTGLEKDARIIEIGAVKAVNGKVCDSFCELIKPDVPIPRFITALTGIADCDVADARQVQSVLADFRDFSEGFILLGHNVVSFDCRVVRYWATKYKISFDNSVFDTLRFVRLNKDRYPLLKSKKLSDLCDYFGVEANGFHRAKADAYAAAQVYFSP